MTLNSNEIVYTADFMNISPANDAQIYGMGGNYILGGLEIRDVTSTSATLTAGRALIQGRLFELKANTQYTLTAGISQYLGLEIDLTKENVDDGMGNITNNQFTVKSNDREYGDTLSGDVSAFVAFYKISSDGSTTQKIFKYSDVAKPEWIGTFSDYDDEQSVVAVKEGKLVQIYGAVTNKYTTPVDGEFLNICQFPDGFRPKYQINERHQGSQMNTFWMQITTDGRVLINRFGNTSNIKAQPGSWWPIGTTFTVD